MKRIPKSKRQLAPRKLPTECLCCGASQPWVKHCIPQTSPLRGLDHCINAEVMQCRHCDAVTTTAAQDAALLAQTKQAHSQWIGLSIRRAMKELSLSQREFASTVNIGSATLSRALKADTLLDASTEELLFIKIQELREIKEKNEWLNLTPKHFSSFSCETPSASWFSDDPFLSLAV